MKNLIAGIVMAAEEGKDMRPLFVFLWPLEAAMWAFALVFAGIPVYAAEKFDKLFGGKL